MTDVYEDKLVPEQIVRSLAHTLCDMCNKPIHDDDTFTSVDVNVSMRVDRHAWGECDTELSEIDMCRSCFIHKLEPWLEESMANPEALEVKHL